MRLAISLEAQLALTGQTAIAGRARQRRGEG